MSRCKSALVSWAVLLVVWPAYSQQPAQAQPQPQYQHLPASVAKKTGTSFYNLLLGFTAWTEQVSLSKANASDTAAANLFGNAITFEYERYPHLRWGYYLVGSALFGTANVAGSQRSVSYQLAGQTWLGAVLSMRGGYRLYKQVAFTVGPVVLYRSLSLPGSEAGVTASSGADLNYGATADMRLRLGNSWELRQELGMLMLKASAYWSLGFGYKF